MEKNYLQDVIPPAQKRSIRNIPIPGNRRVENTAPPESPKIPEVPKTVDDDILPPPPQRPPMTQYEDQEEYKPRSRKPLMFLVGIIIVAIIFFVLATVFAHATVTLTPKEAEATISTTVAIGGNGTSTPSLQYEEVKVTQEASKELKATGEEKVNDSASGKITVYNNYSDKPQPLVKRTRFETPEGKIFRIQDSIVVPGYKAEGGKTVPGSIEVEVFADEAGDSYNVEASDFTIPGFKDMEQFDKFYAKSTTSMTGGFVGVRKVVSKEDIEKASKDLEAQLQTELISQANEKKTEDKILVYDEQSVAFDSVKQKNGEKDTVIVSRTGTLTAYSFDALELSARLAGVTLDSYEGAEAIKIDDVSKLDFRIIRGAVESLGVEGDAKFVWQIDAEEVIEKITGTAEGEFKKNIEDIKGINNATVVLKPFWKSTFPAVEDIEVKIKSEN